MDAFINEISRPDHVAHDYDGCEEKHKPVSIILDELGKIVDCCQGDERFFGFNRSELENRHISTLFPQLSEFQLSDGDLYSRLDYLHRCRTLFLTKNSYGHTFKSELHFVEEAGHGPMRTIRLIVSPFYWRE
jgi:hypothetical protein